MSSLFVYVGAIGFVLGISIRSARMISFEIILLCIVLGVALALLCVKKKSVVVLSLSIFLIAASCGMLRLQVSESESSVFTDDVNTNVRLEGVVVREPDIRSATQHLYVKESQSGELLLVTTDAYLDVSYGDFVSFEGVLKEPDSFETDLGRTFDYKGYLRAKGVEYVISFAHVEVGGHGAGNSIILYLLSAKQHFMKVLERYVPEPEAGLGEGLLLGVKRALGEDLEEAFRRVGIIHIVVLSGFNIMIVAEAIMRLLTFFFRPRTRVVLGVITIGLFAVMVGLGSTVVRASIMAVLVLIARVSGRTYAILRALTFAGCVMLLLNPYLLMFDPGFQLSFLATLGLIFVAPNIERFLHVVPTVLGIRGYMTATLATQIMVLPLLLYLMGQFSVVAVLVNILVLPMVPYAMLLTFIAGMVGMFIPQLGLLFGFFAHLSLLYIVSLARFFSDISFAAFGVPAFPFWVVVLLYMGIIGGLWIFRIRRQKVDTQIVPSLSNLDDWTIVPLYTIKKPGTALTTVPGLSHSKD